jgi:serine/threonine-protein kinase
VEGVLERLNKALADRYRIEHELGRGGMAVVYLAEDLKHRRRVALKVLRPELGASLGAERFLREIEIAAGLAHPNILPLHDSGEADGLLYYVMPYVEGESLRDRLAREKQLPIDDALQVTREVADALGHAHSVGIIHRDVKPENVLFVAGHAVVADFGIARAVSEAGGEGLTETGLAVGTPAYMSPEQASGERELDSRSDVYALGCMLYEMLAGQPPFTGPTVESIVRQHIASELPPVRNLRPTVPDGVEETLATALAKSPADRFASTEVFVQRLSAEAVGTPRPGAPPASERTLVRVIAVTGVIVVIAAVALGIWLRSPAPTGAIRLAVLPFDNLSGAAEDRQFTDGVHEEVLNRLSWVRDLQVTSRTSSVAYRNTDEPLPAVARALGVDYVVEGSVRRGGDQLRITVQLIDVPSGERLRHPERRGAPDCPRSGSDSLAVGGSAHRPEPDGELRGV